MNWKKLIKDLAHKRVTQKQMAKFCKCSQAAISSIAKGVTVDPRYSLGWALIKLGKRHRIALEPMPDIAEIPNLVAA
jgi:predicted transcriptional regulator